MTGATKPFLIGLGIGTLAIAAVLGGMWWSNRRTSWGLA